jgi:hypothetical protein
MAEALFDRVDDTPTEMPDHLQGKTPKEVNDYWAGRERQMRTEMQAERPDNPPKPPTPKVELVTPGGMTPGQAQTLVAGAKMVAAAGKEHWQRFLPEVEAIMGNMTSANQMDANMWSTVYEKVVGMHTQDLIKEAVAKATTPPSMESSSPPSSEAAPRSLSAGEVKVVEGLKRAGATTMRGGREVPFDAEAYINAEKRVREGAWPLTFQNY